MKPKVFLSTPHYLWLLPVLTGTAAFTVLGGPARSADAARPKLRWAPPKLENPQTIEVEDGYTSVKLKTDRDYILELPPHKKVGGLVIQGGRNVVVQGGYISMPMGGTNQAEKRAIYIKGSTGTVHIEGVLIDNSESGTAEFDGVAIAAPEAIVQLENLRIIGLTGSLRSVHADLVQPWGGVKELRIDRMTGTSNYQGLQIPTDTAPIGSSTLQNINMAHSTGPNPKLGFLLWMTTGNRECNTYPISLKNVYVVPRPGLKLGRSVWPSDTTPDACPAVVKDGEATWPSLAQIQGSVKEGLPPGGDFVPEGVAGVHYVSPGYEKTD